MAPADAISQGAATSLAAPFWWVQPTVVGVGIFASIVVALVTITTTRRIARIKATLDLIESSESKEYYTKLYECYKTYRKDSELRAKALNPKTDEDKKFRDQCHTFLNHYELIAIGFVKGILDEDFYRRWMEPVVVRDYCDGAELIEIAREPPDQVAYIYFEALCRRWGQKSIHGFSEARKAKSRGAPG